MLNFWRRTRLFVIIVICVIFLNVLSPGLLKGFILETVEELESIVTQKN